ncbi:MAG: hypothetical protein CMQ39_06690 [Gammaproteobacteria bacterium]|nr:hypothetical protein [Gammaproteobacteria bacterium]|tara:strand:+ start:722 stop:1111 length:390 start_codon:yes stop_codon:yes gene_type:complete
MKKFVCIFTLVLACQARADDPMEGLEPVASAPQVIVVYRNECTNNEKKAIEMVKDLIEYEKTSSPIAYSSVPGIWDDGTIGAIDLHQSLKMMEQAFEWQKKDESWTSQYNAIVSACGGNEFEPSYMVAE